MATAEADALRELNKLFAKALLALGEAGQAEDACRLAAEGWSRLRGEHPKEAERLNGVLHALTGARHHN